MKRVCRAALQCEAYSLQHVTEHGDILRASVLEILGKLLVRGEWEEVARQSMLHVQYSGCRSLTDHFLPSIPKQIEDKRLSIELGGLGQMLWEDDIPGHEALAPYGDILRWIATHVELADCATKSMKPHFLNLPTKSLRRTVRQNRARLQKTSQRLPIGQIALPLWFHSDTVQCGRSSSVQ